MLPDIANGLIDFGLMDLIGKEEAERLQAIPLFRVHDSLTVAMVQPQ